MRRIIELDDATYRGVKVEIHPEDERGNVITLLEDLIVIWGDRVIRVPAGFKSDGASVPRFLWDDVSPAIDQRTIRAAIIHDWIYRMHPEGWTRKMADDLFYDFCRVDGLSWWRSQKAYWGVRMFGGYSWYESYARDREGKENAQC
jgi:hypothetical protein